MFSPRLATDHFLDPLWVTSPFQPPKVLVLPWLRGPSVVAQHPDAVLAVFLASHNRSQGVVAPGCPDWDVVAYPWGVLPKPHARVIPEVPPNISRQFRLTATNEHILFPF